MPGFCQTLVRVGQIVGTGALSALIGCRGTAHTPAGADLPRGAIPMPAGSFACQWQTAQTHRADEDDFVFYSSEWSGPTAILSPAGQRHLEQILPRLATQPAAVLVVESSGDAELDALRQKTLLEQAAALGLALPPPCVTIASPRAEGLLGLEAPRMARGYVQTGLPGGGGMSGGLTGASPINNLSGSGGGWNQGGIF
jgi:hypothetical protein